MSGLVPSLTASVRNTTVYPGSENRMFSDRFLNSDTMSCIAWNGYDSVGQEVCADSFYTKAPGCNSALDRVDVENAIHRPQYMNLLTLGSQGILGGGIQPEGSMTRDSTNKSRSQMESLNPIDGPGGHWTFQNVGNVRTTFPSRAENDPYSAAMKSIAADQQLQAQLQAQKPQVERYNGSCGSREPYGGMKQGVQQAVNNMAHGVSNAPAVVLRKMQPQKKA